MQITRAPGKNACPNENSALFGRVLSARTIMYELLICFKWFFVLASIIECDMQRVAFEFWQFSGIVTYSHRSSNGRSRSLIPHSLRILCSFFHLRTTIIKNNLHLLFFLLFALFSCILFSTYTHTETAFLFIYLLSAVFFLLLLFYFPLFVVCVFFCCLRIRRLRAHHLYLPLVLYEKCRCFHASECVEMCFDCRALVTWCANNCKKYL